MSQGAHEFEIKFKRLPFDAPIQFLVQIKASTVSGSRRPRNGSTTRPPALNAGSEATVYTCIDKISRASRDRIGNST